MGFWFILGAVLLNVIGYIFRPKPKIDEPQPSGLGEFQVPTADASRRIPVVFGTCLLKGANVLWYGDLKTTPIVRKSSFLGFTLSSQTVGYRYYLGMMLGLCQGAIDVFRSLRFDDHIADMSVSTAGDVLLLNIVSPRNSRLFGGDDGEGGIGGTVEIHVGQGSPSTGPSLYLQTHVHPDISAYPFLAYAVLRQCYVGNSRNIKNVAFELSRYPNTLGLTGGEHIISTYDANPAAILYELLIDPVWGIGMDSSRVDLANLQAIGHTLFTEDFGLSFQIDSPMKGRDAIFDVLRHIDGVFYSDLSTGLAMIKLARKDYDVATIPLLDQSSVDDVDWTRTSWLELSNVARIRYVSRADNYTQQPAQQQNLAGIQTRGDRIDQTFDFLSVSRASVANAIAARTLKTISYPLAKLTITCNRKAHGLMPGDVFKLNWPPEGIVGMVCRVVRPAYGTLGDGRITIDAVEDIFSIGATAFTAPSPSTWTDPIGAPLAAIAQQLIEAPYHLVGGPERFVLAMAARAAGTDLGYDIWSDPAGGTTYAETGKGAAFTPSGLLTASYAASTAANDATGFTVGTGIDLAELVSVVTSDFERGSNLLLIDQEIMAFKTVVDNGNGTWTIKDIYRGVFDTVPAAHSSGARVWFIAPAGAFALDAEHPYPADGNVRAKLLPFNPRGILDLASATAMLLTTASRAQKPYPPGNVKIAGVAWPTSVTGGVDIAVTWAHRHRVTQTTDQKVVAQDASSYVVTPEGDYTIEVRVGGTLVRTAAGTTGTTWTWTAAMQTTDGATVGSSISIRVIPVNGSLVGTYQERLFTIS